MVAAWALFFLPFLADVVVAAQLLWGQLDWRQRGMVAVVALVLYSVLAAYRR
jgi:hypothetical protein